MSWYSTQAEDVSKAAHEQREERARNMIGRLWVKPLSTVPIVVCDKDYFNFWEHEIYFVASKERSHYTCLQKIGQHCPICAYTEINGKGNENSPIKISLWRVTVFTVIDFTEWTDKKGVKHTKQKRLWVLKPDSAELLIKKVNDRWGGSIYLKSILVSRKDNKDAASGSDFELEMRNGAIVNRDMTGIDIAPYNYAELFKPLSADKIREENAFLSNGMPMASSPNMSAASVPTGAGNGGAPQMQSQTLATGAGSSPLDDSIPF